MASTLNAIKDASPLTPYLPQEDGLLPRWLLLIGTISTIYTIQSFFSLQGAREIYTSPAALITPLQSRTFGAWSGLSSIVRLYAAYHIHDKVAYELCLLTWGIAFAHFVSEWLVFGTAKMGRGLISPILVAGISGAWMLAQWESYVR